MGTLTAGQPRLDVYCEHKLPTSCRLSSIPQCCACADERAHAASYSTYVDGVGFVPWGTRWQRYCWFCSSFWQQRVRASGLTPAQSRIPAVPSQEEFLSRWYEFHQGYRIVLKEDGSEERVAVLGEDFREVSPGFLPRTLEELRAGRAPNDMAEQTLHGQQAVEEQRESGPSIEEALDQMFQEASLEESQQHVSNSLSSRNVEQDHSSMTGQRSVQDQTSGDVARVVRDSEHAGSRTGSNIHAQAMVPAANRNREYQARRIAALRRELHRMRNGIERVISGLRDLGENVPDHAEATGRLTDLGRTLDAIDGSPSHDDAERAINSVNALTQTAGISQTDRTMASMQARVDEARQHANEARRARDQAAAELDLAEQESRTSQQRLQQLQREQRTTENYLRLFGTREEMIAQGDQYESPIGGMFSRAYERFRAAEEVRREERTLRQVLEDEARAGGEQEARRLAALEARERDVWGVPRAPVLSADALREVAPVTEPPGELEEYYALLRRQEGLRAQPGTAPHVESILEQPPTMLQSLERAASDVVQATSNSDTPLSPIDPNNTFPTNMLRAVRSARERELAERNNQLVAASREESDGPITVNAVAPDHLQPGEEWRLDVEHVLRFLLSDRTLCEENMLDPDTIYNFLERMGSGTLSHGDLNELNDILQRPRAIWAAKLIAARFARRRRAGLPIVMLRDIPQDDFQRTAENTEIMAEAFSMSSELRRKAPGLTAPEQLRMLYALQAGERQMADVAKLDQMLRDPETFELAARVHAANQGETFSGFELDRQQRLEEQRRRSAREGDNSRQELDTQRRATQAFAIAAGRTAMRTGSRVLLEQMANRDEETRAAYSRLRENGFDPDSVSQREQLTTYRALDVLDYASESDSDSEKEDEAQGLDAKDTGRPEPKADEELTVTMECRICYTQLAEIACLPCGHLVMCKWCSEQHSPVMAHDRTRPRRAAGCPVCRKSIRQKVRVFRA